MLFFSYIVEDKNLNGLSYIEFLIHIHRQIQMKMWLASSVRYRSRYLRSGQPWRDRKQERTPSFTAQFGHNEGHMEGWGLVPGFVFVYIVNGKYWKEVNYREPHKSGKWWINKYKSSQVLWKHTIVDNIFWVEKNVRGYLTKILGWSRGWIF